MGKKKNKTTQGFVPCKIILRKQEKYFLRPTTLQGICCQTTCLAKTTKQTKNMLKGLLKRDGKKKKVRNSGLYRQRKSTEEEISEDKIKTCIFLILN